MAVGYNGPLGFDEQVDTDNFFNNPRFQPTVAGWYELTVEIVLSGLGSGGQAELYLTQNDTAAANTPPVSASIRASDYKAARADGWTTLWVTAALYFNGTTDYAEIKLWVAVACALRGGVYRSQFEASGITQQGPPGPVGSPPRVTSLTAGVGGMPTIISDGLEVYFVADVANGVMWHLKYNAGSTSPYKWELVGGPPLVATVVGSDTGAADGTFRDYTTIGPQIVTPLAGDWDIESMANIFSGVGQNDHCVVVNGVQENGLYAQEYTPAGSWAVTGTIVWRRLAAASGTTFKMQYRGSGGGTGTARWRALRMRPVRVG
jgi:hypothetical protein